MIIGVCVLCVAFLGVFLIIRKTSDAEEFEIQNKTLVRYHGKSAVVSVPEGIEIIGNAAFRDCNRIREVIMPASVREIGELAFDNCKRLVRVSLSPAVTMLKEGVFLGCKALRQLDNTGGITEVHVSAFYATTYGEDCEETIFLGKCLYRYRGAGARYEVPKGTVQICGRAFSGCKELCEVILPVGLRQIDGHAFNGCDGLKEVVIPTETSIGWGAFVNCENLRKIEYSGERRGCLRWVEGTHDYTVSSEGNPFCGRTKGIEWRLVDEEVVVITNVWSDGEDIIIPESIEGYPVVELGYAAFFNNRKVRVVTLPKTIRYIEAQTFMADTRCVEDKDWAQKDPVLVKLNITLRGEQDSYIHLFANEHEIPFEEIENNVQT